MPATGRAPASPCAFQDDETLQPQQRQQQRQQRRPLPSATGSGIGVWGWRGYRRETRRLTLPRRLTLQGSRHDTCMASRGGEGTFLDIVGTPYDTFPAQCANSHQKGIKQNGRSGIRRRSETLDQPHTRCTMALNFACQPWGPCNQLNLRHHLFWCVQSLCAVPK